MEFHPMTVALGAISRKPAVVGDHVEAREFLGMTIVFDHDVVDGAPVAMFLQRVRERMETAFALSCRAVDRPRGNRAHFNPPPIGSNPVDGEPLVGPVS